nr:MAG TPA: hypothetical protein [Caudoviricetes sp.]
MILMVTKYSLPKNLNFYIVEEWQRKLRFVRQK